jgi:hypothetical protein
LAALSVQNNQNVRQINIRKLQQTLLDAGAYLMPLVDIGPTDKDFQAIQRITASGILKIKGESHDWANRSWFYPDTTITVKEFSDGLNAFEPKISGNNDQSLLTIEKYISLINNYLNKDVSEEIQKIWESRVGRKFDVKLAITKRELCVLTDELIRPFETKSIGFNGNYKN